jgi:hypothetical protein
LVLVCDGGNSWCLCVLVATSLIKALSPIRGCLSHVVVTPCLRDRPDQHCDASDNLAMHALPHLSTPHIRACVTKMHLHIVRSDHARWASIQGSTCQCPRGSVASCHRAAGLFGECRRALRCVCPTDGHRGAPAARVLQQDERRCCRQVEDAVSLPMGPPQHAVSAGRDQCNHALRVCIEMLPYLRSA